MGHYFEWVGVGGALFWVDGGRWDIILDRLGWLGPYFGWVGVVGPLFWVGRDHWGIILGRWR